MHIPKKFRQEDTNKLIALIKDFPFATLIGSNESGAQVMHLPLLIKNEDGQSYSLNGHIAKVNPFWQQIKQGDKVVAVFHGPNCYISPNHYPTKLEHGKAVPTWNYVVVHAEGNIKFHHDKEWLYTHIDELSQQHEQKSEKPWSINDAPEDYIQKMLPAIVGIEISINNIEGQWKLSQNQPAKNQQGVIQGLMDTENPNAQAIAKMMITQQ